MHQRFASLSAIKASSSPRSDAPKYVSPTFKSSIFNHTEGEDPAPARGIRTHQSFHRMSEDLTQASRGGWHTASTNHTLPTVSEWIPKRHHINDHNVYDNIEEEAIAHAKKKQEQHYNEHKQRKEHLNREYNEVLATMEKKHASRLDHRKPTDDDKKTFKEVQNNHVDDIMDKKKKQETNNKTHIKTLDQQIEEKVRRKQLELQKERTDMRTGLDLKPRQQHDIEEHRNTLKAQLEEKQQKKAQTEQAKQQEKHERLKNLQEQEAIWSAYREKLAMRKTQSSEGLHMVHKVDLFEEKNKKQAAPQRFSTIVRNEGSPERSNNHWDAVSKALLKRKEQQDQYLIDLKEQMIVKKKTKEAHHFNEKHEEKKQSGLKLGYHKPKESAAEIAEIVKKQLATKEEAKKTEIKLKLEEKSKVIDSHKAHEEAMRQKHQETKQQKAEMHTHYKISLTESASKKKHGGLTTVKI